MVKNGENGSSSIVCMYVYVYVLYVYKYLKDGPGPVMVSDTLCPAVHILGT